MTDSVAKAADGMVTGDRMDDYGHPFHQHTLYGKVWADLLGLPAPIPPKTVALLLVAMKVCRETIKPKRDNLIDACGYAVCADMIDEYKPDTLASQPARDSGVAFRCGNGDPNCHCVKCSVYWEQEARRCYSCHTVPCRCP